ncbi:MAG TPA: hypothetical protein VFZ78_10420 [Flavisolibacter sp.]
MQQIRKTINGIDFSFEQIFEGTEEVFRVRADNHDFKMTCSEKGRWLIRQQVPNWIRVLEPELENGILAMQEKTRPASNR